MMTTEYPVTQEHPMGCGLACVAYVSSKSYQAIFGVLPKEQQAKAWADGFYCEDLCKLLGPDYEWTEGSTIFQK